jgi:hypothetical protein
VSQFGDLSIGDFPSDHIVTPTVTIVREKLSFLIEPIYVGAW